MRKRNLIATDVIELADNTSVFYASITVTSIFEYLSAIQ